MRSNASLDWPAKILSTFIIALAVFFIYKWSIAENIYEAGGLAFATNILGALIIYCYAFAVRYYSIENNDLIIHRLAGRKTFDLGKLRAVDTYAGVKKGWSWRTFGNGGLFGYSGYFYNPGIGDFKMFATNRNHLIILNFGDHKIGISPDDRDFSAGLHPAFT